MEINKDKVIDELKEAAQLYREYFLNKSFIFIDEIINTGTIYKIHSILKSTVDSNISTNHFCRFFAASMSPERHSVRMDQTPRKAYIIFLIKKQQQE